MPEPDKQHNVLDIFGGAFEGKATNLIADDGHSCGLYGDNGRMKIICNQCDYEWSGKR